MPKKRSSDIYSATFKVDRKSHETFMNRALLLAAKGQGKTFPNPCVGAVLVKNRQIIGEGWHKKSGLSHAEINALEDCRKKGFDPRETTLYVTLSPCCHFGKTPPCTDTIIRAGIHEVFAAIADPNPLTRDTPNIFKKNGILYHVGLFGKEALALNEPYFVNIVKKRPYVTLKIAMSLNGKISGQKGRYITSKESLCEVHRLRAKHDAVLVGSGTVVSDNPHLGVRHVKGKDPLRVILDSRLRIPVSAQIFRDKNVLIFTTAAANGEKIQQIRKNGAEIVVSHKKMPLAQVLRELYQQGVARILVEGGQTVFTSFFQEQLFDCVLFFIAPKVISHGKNFVAEPISPNFTFVHVEKIGNDLFAEAKKTLSS